MGYLRFRRYIRFFPGLRLNISKSGVSVSAGVRGAHYTASRTGTRTTVGLPGSGLSYTNFKRYPHQAALPPTPPTGPAPDGRGWFLRLLFPRNNPVATASEFETWKATVISALAKADPTTRANCILAGDRMIKYLDMFDKNMAHLEAMMKLEISFDSLLLEMAQRSFLLRYMGEDFATLDFISITTADGGRNSKDDSRELLTSIADMLNAHVDLIPPAVLARPIALASDPVAAGRPRPGPRARKGDKGG
jgi:hypothetical protein